MGGAALDLPGATAARVGGCELGLAATPTDDALLAALGGPPARSLASAEADFPRRRPAPRAAARPDGGVRRSALGSAWPSPSG